MQFAPLCEQTSYHIGGKQPANIEDTCIGDRATGKTPAGWYATGSGRSCRNQQNRITGTAEITPDRT